MTDKTENKHSIIYARLMVDFTPTKKVSARNPSGKAEGNRLPLQPKIHNLLPPVQFLAKIIYSFSIHLLSSALFFILIESN